jgi:very-short-patch-repair endonuclease
MATPAPLPPPAPDRVPARTSKGTPLAGRVDRRVATLAERQHGLLTRAQALAGGLTPRSLDGRLSSGQWTRLHPEVYRVGGAPPSWEQVVLAACLAVVASTRGAPAGVRLDGGDVLTSHRTAARLWGLPTGGPGTIELLVPHARKVQVTGATARRSRVMPPAVLRSGIPATPLEWTLMDLAGVLPDAELVTVLDYALGHRALSLPRLDKLLAHLGCRGRRGAGLLRSLVAERAGRRSFTPIENAFRAAIAARGLPPPEEQFIIVLPDGRLVVIDFAWVAQRLAVGVDSFTNHSSLSDWAADHRRNQKILLAGWLPLDVTSAQIAEDPEGVADLVAQVLSAIDAGAVPGFPGPAVIPAARPGSGLILPPGARLPGQPIPGPARHQPPGEGA